MANPRQVTKAKEQTTSEHDAEELAASDAEVQEKQRSAAEKREDLLENMDALLDEIDSVMTDNAVEMAMSYVQQGGE